MAENERCPQCGSHSPEHCKTPGCPWLQCPVHGVYKPVTV